MLSDKVFVVAGGGQGLGEAAAIELGSHGGTVVVNDLGVDVHGEGGSAEPAEETAAAVREAGGEAMAHFGDVTDMDYTEELVADAVAEYGRLDGVVNFAGILRDSISYKMTGDQWDEVIDVHLRGHFSLLRNTAAHWRERAGETDDDSLADQRAFLTVTSRAALGSIGQINYASAKGGIMAMTRTAARELYRYNVRVNSLMPAAFTRMIEEIPEEQRSFTEEELPPEKVGPMVAYMLSDGAEDITGRTVLARGDQIGIVSNPQLVRSGYKDGGWTLEDIDREFRENVAGGIELTMTEREF